MKEMEMKKMGIKEIAKQTKEFADKKLMGSEGCVTFTDNEIVLCVKDEPEYHTIGVTFEADTPRQILTTVTNIINRMVFNLNPAEAAAIITSTVPKAIVHRGNNSSSYIQNEKTFLQEAINTKKKRRGKKGARESCEASKPAKGAKTTSVESKAP